MKCWNKRIRQGLYIVITGSIHKSLILCLTIICIFFSQISMNARLGHTTANRDARTLLAPSHAPVTLVSHWRQMEGPASRIPLSPSVEAGLQLQAAASRPQDGLLATQKTTSSVNGSSTSPTIEPVLNSELTHRLSGSTEGLLVPLTISSSLKELGTVPTPWKRSVVS
jgi:hypothetical protein